MHTNQPNYPKCGNGFGGGGDIFHADVAVVVVVVGGVVAAAAAEPGVRAEQVGDPRRAAKLPGVPAVVRAGPLLPRRACRLVRGVPRAGARRARRRVALAPGGYLAVPGVRVGDHVQPRRADPGDGAGGDLVRHARRLLPPLRRAPAAAVPRRRTPRRHRLRATRVRAGAGPRVPPPGRAAPPVALRRGRAQGRLLLRHRARRATAPGAAAPPPRCRRAVARGGADGHCGVVGVPHGCVPPGVRAVPPHVRAPDPQVRGDLPHVRRRGARRRHRDLRRAPPHPHAASRHQPPVQGVHPLLPRHHHRQPARRPRRRPLLQGRQELRQLRRPPGRLVGAAERLLHVPVRRGEDHAQSAKDRVHREPVAHEHGVRGAPRQIGAIAAGAQLVGQRRGRAAPTGARDDDGVRLQKQTRPRDLPVPQQRRDHAVRVHARQGIAPHHLRLRDDSGAMDSKQSCSPLLIIFSSS